MRTSGLAVSVVLFLAASCSGGGSVVTADIPAGADSTADGSGNPDVVDVPGAEEVSPDFRTEPDELFVQPGCEPGTGCFGEKCHENSDCQSGWCIDHMGDGICTQTCTEECPQGFKCQQLGAAAPDLVFVCISDFANLCRPCQSSADCKAQAGAEDVCVGYGSEGSFCGGACKATQECPWGFSCKQAFTVDGIETMQCVADAGVCPCTARSVELALWTACEVSNAVGKCAGKRVCAEEGLSPCDAATPVEESCNGADDDCDGDSDEPALVRGKLTELCDDGNDCTEDLCSGAAGCEHVALSDIECKDGNTCTVADHCQDGACVGKSVDCDDKNPCTDDSCDEAGGCINEPNLLDCDDGDPCTVADQCKSGNCTGFQVACDCESDSDCKVLEDGDVCNGTLYCDTTAIPFHCAVAPASVKTCQQPAGVDAPCLAAACDPVTGMCSFEPANDGGPCADDSACTLGDSCVAGQCSGGPAANCNDGNPCTDDVCDPAGGCQHFPNGKSCSDGNVCTTGDLCNEGACVPSGELPCDDGNPCTDDTCIAAAGCQHVSNQGPCDDGNACTTGDACTAGQCKPTGIAFCDDGNACTADSCQPANGCFHQPMGGSCSDGNPCTIGDQCELGACKPGIPMACDDGNACTDDSCVQGKCIHAPNQAVCDDGNACTKGDACSQGACAYVALTDCNDDNTCTSDICDPLKGCLHLLNSAPCDDGSACTTGDLCKLGQCAGTATLSCNDFNPCTDDSCDPKTGCVFKANSAQCNDGNLCTSGDLCQEGKCVSGEAVACDDANVCTTDACDPKTGCTFVHNTNPCSDGSACTAADACQDGKCVPGPQITCNDGNSCTDDSCNAGAGCQFVPNSAPCDDGNVCTIGDQCAAGKCGSTGSLDCDDANVCTTDACQPVGGCTHTPIDAFCDDGNVCTDDSCHAVNGCQHVPIDASCDDKVACTQDSCHAVLGCQHSPLDALCNDNNVCTDDTCHVTDGCKKSFNSAPCNDGKDCTSPDVCSAGTCTGTPGKIKIVDSMLGVVTMLSCSGGNDGFNYVCHYLGYGDATGDHPQGDFQAGGPCWAIGEADGKINTKYASCGSGCTHWSYVECWTCK
ncbi:MAG: hypothetical protein FJ109_06010 [Deltaproteobacteria bacterium]|nr:hypothetical protein [Deltaproteobacteria bacterium]